MHEKRTGRLKPLVVFCDPGDRDIEALDEIFRNGFFREIEAAISFSASEKGVVKSISSRVPVFLPFEAESLLNRLGLFDLILTFPLSLNTLAKFALGIQDSLPSKILGAASMKGMPILLDETSIPKPDGQMNPHMVKIYRRHWETVIGGTIAAFTPRNLDEILPKIIRNLKFPREICTFSGRSVITRDDILRARECLGPLKVSPGSIITHLALEEAEKLGIKIVFE